MDYSYSDNPKNSTDKAETYRDRSPLIIEIDNMLRRSLRVSDPGNFEELRQHWVISIPFKSAKWSMRLPEYRTQ